MNHLPPKPTKPQIARAVRDNEPSAGPGLLALQGNIYQPSQKAANLIVRMRVTTLKTSTWGLCRVWDGMQERSGDYAVRLTQTHAVNDEILVAVPSTGVFGNILDDSTPPRKIILQELGSATPSVFPVKVSSDGGSAGAIGSTCSFTYTVTDLNGNDLKDGMSTTATGKPPILARRIPNVTYTVAPAGSYATAFYDEAGTLRLVDVQETFSTTKDCG